MKTRRGGGLLLLNWARFPRKADELFRILADTRDDELVLLATSIGGPGGHIAWAEYGRRHYGMLFGVQSGGAVPMSVPLTCELAS